MTHVAVPRRTEVPMLQHPHASFFTIVGLLPFALAACTHADSSDDPRTQSPVVRVTTVEPGVYTDRSFTGVVAARVQSDLGFRVARQGPGAPGRYRPNRAGAANRSCVSIPRICGSPRAHKRRLLPPPRRARARPRWTRRDTAALVAAERFRHRRTTRSRLPPSRQERSSMRPKPTPMSPATRRATLSCSPMRTAS